MHILDGRVDLLVERPLRLCNYFDLTAGTSTGGFVAFFQSNQLIIDALQTDSHHAWLV
jgi:hypothetical protein